ncbi:MAG: SAM-dependent methyltransferase [Acidimicrobiia bacterium]|nr:SAM-dependent methyltransferase [Acidimicrobiia bacterium]
MSAPFRPGEVCLLVDGKGRHYLVDLDPAGVFQYHVGTLPLCEIIGKPEGSAFRSSGEGRLVALRPRLADYILRMQRGAQVVYPKDIGPMLHWGDIGPGMTVLEAGTGSGALTMALVRAVGPGGRVVSLEERPDHAAGARAAIARFLGEIPLNLDLRVGRVEDVVTEVAPERLVLDLPEPWAVVPPAAAGLAAGGILTAYLPTVPQVQRLHDELRRSRSFLEATTFEVLFREWVVEGRSVRPTSQMVGHTGFITVARRVVGDTGSRAESPEAATEPGDDERPGTEPGLS